MRNFVVLCLTIASLSGAYGQSFVYVSLAGDKKIATFTLAEDTGELTPQGHIDVGSGPGALCTDPTSKFLFASIRSVGNLASFRINDDGSLTKISEVSAGADPAYVSSDHSGKYLLSAYYRAGKVMVHAINDGKLGENAAQTFPTDEKAHAAVFDRSGKFVYVPHTGPNTIFQFRFDGGKLKPNDPLKLIRPAQTGPRHLSMHPTLDFAYGSDEQGNSITAYQFDPASGLLNPTQTLSSLPPEGHEGGKSTSHVEVHPAGKFVYIANRGHDSITGYAIDPQSGRLSYLTNTKTEKTPRSFNIDPSGRYLIAAGQNSATLASYKIESDGSLQPLAVTATGSKPWWVLIVRQ